MDELQSEDEAYASNIQTEALETESGHLVKRSTHKQIKNTAHTNRNFFIQFSFAVIAVIGYFMAMFFMAKEYIQNMEIASKEMSYVASIES